MTPIAQAISAALLHFVWQGLLVASLLWIALFLLKNRSANARYLASSAALAALALLPAITAVLLFRQSTPVSGQIGFVPSNWTAAAGLTRAPGAQFAWLPVLQAWALPLWSAGVLILSLRLALGYRQVSSLRRQGEPAPESILLMTKTLSAKLALFRQVSIVVTGQADSPSVIGWLRPAILLPAATLLNLTEQQLEAVLAHELAHIRRHDYLVNLLQNLVETVLFYHPAVWWTSARMRHERELCCDDVAVHSCGDAICYARALTTIEKMRLASPTLALGSAGGDLLFRIQRLMGLKPRETAPSRVPAIAALVLGVACLALNMNWARAQEQGRVELREAPGVLGSVNAEDGPGVQIDLGGAKIIERAGVEYPGYAWEHKIGGIVVVEATQGSEGNVSDARVLNGPVELRKVALQSILEWHFTPAPAGTTHQISINFQWEQAQKAREGAVTRLVVINGQEHSFAAQAQEFENIRKGNAEIRAISVFPGQAEGRSVTRIQISGMSEMQQKQLSERLPVHLGDTLTHNQIESLTEVLQKIDPTLVHTFSFDENGKTEIQIFRGK